LGVLVRTIDDGTDDLWFFVVVSNLSRGPEVGVTAVETKPKKNHPPPNQAKTALKQEEKQRGKKKLT